MFSLSERQFLILLGLAAAGGVWLYVKRDEIGRMFNPGSRDNLAYTGVNAVGAEITGDGDFSLGAWLWEKVNADKVAVENEIIGGV